MNNIDYFVIGHDEKYNTSLSHKFLLVGSNTSRTRSSNTIVCKNLPFNLENYPYLCSFTAWYAVSVNKLYESNYISLLEYDTLPSNIFYKNNQQIICNNNSCVIGYSQTLTNHYVFTKSTPWLELSLKSVYNIDLMEFIEKYSNQFPLWITTTNITMSVDVLNSFCNWFEPMTKLFRLHKLGSYVHERAFFIFCILNNIPIFYLPDTIFHSQKCSHGINDIYGSFLKSKSSKILYHYMIDEYNEQYSQSLDLAQKLLDSASPSSYNIE